MSQVGLAGGAVLAWAFLRWKPFRVEVSGPSMAPTLLPGDWAVAVAVGPLGRGHVVVVEHPDRPGFEMVKRVVEVPGNLAPDGRILGPDEWWVEGDSAAGSMDSRRFGPVPRKAIVARVRLIYWPARRLRIL